MRGTGYKAGAFKNETKFNNELKFKHDIQP